MTEEWKPVAGYEGLYEVSNLGRVKSLNYHHTGKEGLLKQNIEKTNPYPYAMVCLYKDGKCATPKVHKLVAMAFIPNPDNLPQVNHKDEDSLNNCVNNLEWCTAKYNANYGTRNKRMAKSLTNGKASKKIAQYASPGFPCELINVWPSLNEIKRQKGWSIGNICAAIKENKTAYGFLWGYFEE
ncbi:MAG: HNH endonuclease [Prevotella sp.]|nr:HNH endonuclease [Prevotella sp.]MBQ2167651.1 HNH endonuclease [Prevotella sp.]